MFYPFEGADRFRHRFRGDVHAVGQGDGRQDVEQIVFAAQLDVGEGANGRFLPILQPDVPIPDKRAIGHRPAQAEGAQPPLHLIRQRQRAGVVGGQHGHVVGALVAQDVGFGVGVGGHRLVPVQVVGGDVQHGGHAGTLPPNLQLEAGKLLHHHVVRGHFVQVGDEGAADVAANPGAPPGHLPNHAGEGGGGGFAGRAGDADNGRWRPFHKLQRIIRQRNPPRAGFGHQRHIQRNPAAHRQ